MNVYKYELEITEEQIIRLPFAAEILTIQMQGDKCCLWALVDPRNEFEDRTICIRGTGHPIQDGIRLKYISTFQIPHLGLVFHAFEKKKTYKRVYDMEYKKDDLRKVFNNVINEIETTDGRVLSMYDVKKLTSQGIPLLDICIKNIPISCLKDGFEKWLNSL